MHILNMMILVALIAGSFQSPGDLPEVRLDREFRLPIGREAVLDGEGLVIRFVGVLEDSRCPQGVDCIWSGNARIEISLSQSGVSPAKMHLNTHLAPQNGSYSSYRISLTNLNPHPKSGEEIDRGSYQAGLIISRK